MCKIPRVANALVWASSGIGLVVFAAIFLGAATPLASAQSGHAGDERVASSRSVRQQLIGSWRLVSRQSRQEDGQILPDPGLSTLPLGVLIYDQSGHVAAQLSRRGRTTAVFGEECQAAAAIKGTPDTAQTVLGYDAYFGTYTLNEKDGIVTHHLEAAIFPGDIGKSIDRHFTLSGDTLTISFSTTTTVGVKVTRTLVWERMK